MVKAVLISLVLAAIVLAAHCNEKNVYIVYMGSKQPQQDASPAQTHHSMLYYLLGSISSAKESLVHSYGRSFNGFVARLTNDEASRVRGMERVISVFPNRILKHHTTRSWDFIGLSTTKVGGPLEADVIIGLIDTGIWPESESFNDKGLTPPPAKWKGTCQGANFTCNNKIIGARFYNTDGVFDAIDIKSPRDTNGHGTHTSSIAGGRGVGGASYLGLGKGRARGGAPSARIAVYTVCWSVGCYTSDIFAAFDDAIADGVDIISISLGSDSPYEYFNDPIAIGSFHAMIKGILTSNSAGNSGPEPVSVVNYSPWTLTVAASTIDRKFVANVVLGNGQVFTGLTVNNFDLQGASYPLIWGGDAVNYTVGSNPDISKYCFPGSMNSIAGVGTIMADSYITDSAFSFPLPATVISTEDGFKVLDYIRTSDNPMATILVGEAWNDTMAPIVASFSSRGPNPISPDILKPDITAPGVDILAAWSPLAPPSIYNGDTRSVNYNIISGTSMSCPHATAAAAHVKAAHPNWSPAAIKSALMTTAYVMDPRKHKDLEFSYGSGHINPVSAVDPGLVFDASESDYIDFLCSHLQNTTLLQLVTGDASVCNKTFTYPGRGWLLNYPSFSLYVLDGYEIFGIFDRSVTNVGAPNSTYTVYTEMPEGVRAIVEPSTLSFSAVGERKKFSVRVMGRTISQQPIMSGTIMWTDGFHKVRSPIVVYNYIPGAPYNLDVSVLKKNPLFEGSSVYHKNRILGHS